MAGKDCSAASLTQGYDALFVKPLVDKYKCSICQKALRNPVQTPCAHRFCETCLQPLLRGDNPSCPIDQEELAPGDVFRDVCCGREVMDLEVYCNNKPVGCPWTGELNNLQGHLKKCEFEEVECPNEPCGARFRRTQQNKHLTEECKYSPLTCTYCVLSVAPSQVETHASVCPEQPVPCELGCGEQSIARSRMDHHLSSECPKVQTHCRFHKEGCQVMGMKEALKIHEKTNVQEHLAMLMMKLDTLSESEKDLVAKLESISSEKKEMEMLVKRLTDQPMPNEQELRAQKTKLNELETLVNEQASEMSVYRARLNSLSSTSSRPASAGETQALRETQGELQQLRARLSKVEKDMAEASRVSKLEARPRERQCLSLDERSPMSTERRLERADHQLTLHDIQLAEHDLKIEMLDNTSYNGIFVWKIDDFTRRRHEAVTGKTVSIYSPPFFLGRFGYKVCARVYPNGDGSGRGTHLSMFFVIMRGEYDALLPWPFQQLVTFKLLNQAGNRSLDIVDSFRPDGNSSSFKRPTSNMNVASGCPMFASLDIIHSGNYLMDDKIFLKVVVDMRGLEA